MEKSARGAGCAICGRETVAAFAPFCSKRCADLDLARWLTGAYAVAAEEEDDLAASEAGRVDRRESGH